jgi:hypothetical protein
MPVENTEPKATAMTLDPVEIEKQNKEKKVEQEQVLRLRGGLGYINPSR